MSSGETIEVRVTHRFDAERLQAYLRTELGGFSGDVHVRQFAGGQSNPTYLIATPGKSYVLRRKPPGVILASAHAVDREFRIISALHQTGFPVPRTLLYCADADVIGTPFYVMECVEGRVLWDPALLDMPLAERRPYHEAMISSLAQLHRLDPVTLGLSDFGKPGNSFARQIARWSKQYQSDPEAGRSPDMDALVDWLPQHIPPGDETAIMHGDYRLDNLIFAPDMPAVAAIIDWELSSLGHPLADLTYLLLMYKFPQTLMKSLAGLDPAALGVPTEAEAVALYCAQAGRQPLTDLNFYHAFNLFRFAAICHGIRGRMQRGNASSALAERYSSHVEPLAALALAHARAAGI